MYSRARVHVTCETCVAARWHAPHYLAARSRPRSCLPPHTSPCTFQCMDARHTIVHIIRSPSHTAHAIYRYTQLRGVGWSQYARPSRHMIGALAAPALRACLEVVKAKDARTVYVQPSWYSVYTLTMHPHHVPSTWQLERDGEGASRIPSSAWTRQSPEGSASSLSSPSPPYLPHGPHMARPPAVPQLRSVDTQTSCRHTK